MNNSIATKIIFNLAAIISLALFVGGSVLIKFHKDILIKSGITGDLTEKIVGQNIILLTVILVFLIPALMVMIYFSLKKIVINPIEKLRQGTEIIAGGNLDYKIRTESGETKNEIDRLAYFFDEMAGKLKKNYAEIEKEIKDKTEELVQKIEKLEKTELALYNILEDVKESEKIIKEERDLFNAVIFSMGEGLIVVDKNYKIILINETAKNKLEVSEEAVGKDIREVAPVVKGNQKIADEEMPVSKTFKTGKPATVWLDDNFYYQLSSGKKFPITLIDAPLIKDGDIVAAVIIFRDVTDEKKLNEAKNNFISIASHQLRTPLTAIRWYSELLEAGDAGKLNEKQKDFLKEIYGGALRLTETLNMLLALARVESGKMKFSPEKIDLIKFTEEILKDLEPFSKPKKIKINLKSEKSTPVVQLDKLILTQVISNLLTNAFRYIKENGKIEIGIVDKSGEIVYSVKDNGIGIPEDQKNRIFERFFRAENALLKAPDGNGLGLYLVKNLVELWKGKVWFESPAVWEKEKKGTVFYFTIPV